MNRHLGTYGTKLERLTETARNEAGFKISNRNLNLVFLSWTCKGKKENIYKYIIYIDI